ncbi:MAG: hypothetical protein KC561_16170, partial [Myxococcales bacterium]|nr:hypothetical protein [Myxococcales bacterium]
MRGTLLIFAGLFLPLLGCGNGEIGVGGQCRFRTGFSDEGYDVRRCVDGAYCASDNHCHAFSKLGEICDNDVYICDSDYICGDRECTVSGACAGTCLAYSTLGAACI